MPIYTAICLYPDYSTGDYGADYYAESAASEDPSEAARAVQKMAHEANPDIPAEDFRVIAVMKGDVEFVLDATSFVG